MSPDDTRHGTYAGAVAHYKNREELCLPCRGAQRRYTKRRKHEQTPRLVPILGFRRRVEALCTLGWGLGQIGDRLGISLGAMSNRMYRSNWISRANHEQMADLYEELCMTHSSAGYTLRTIRVAARKGYAPPLAWDDIDTDEAPNIGTETRRDLLAEYHHLTRCGEAHEQAIRQLGVTSQAIERAMSRRSKRDEGEAA